MTQKVIPQKVVVTCDFCNKTLKADSDRCDASITVKAKSYNYEGFYIFVDKRYDLCDLCYLKFENFCQSDNQKDQNDT